MKEISTDESTPDALRLFADISESKEVAISIYPEFLRDVANEIEQLEKKVKEYEHSSLQHRRLRRPRRNHLDVLVDKAKIETQEEMQKWKQQLCRVLKLIFGGSTERSKVLTTFDEALDPREAPRD